MKKLPEINQSYEGLFKMLIAPTRSKLLLAGIELKVFNVLSENKSSKDVAKAIGTHPKNTKVFLDGLVAIDLLQKKNGLYRNSAVAQDFLVEKSLTYLGRLLTMMKPDDQFLQNLPALVREGPPPPPENPPFSEDAFAKSVVVMADIERAGYVQAGVNIVLGLPEFPSFQKMLDLGGGPGLIGMAIVAVHPTMKGIVFDLPPVVRETRKFIKEYEMEGRMEVLGGDFNHDSIGGGYDLVWTSGALQFCVDIDSVVKKVYDALNANGVFVSVYPFGETHERTKPELTVLNLLSMTLMGQEVMVDHGCIADSMLRVGFRSVHSRNIDAFMGPMELDIARK